MLRKIQRIEICGGIASGKTTFAALLPKLNISLIFENFHANPFFHAFYADPVNTAFETEVTFLLQHYHEIKVASKLGKLFVCDFSLFLDRAYAKVTLSEDKREAFLAVYREVVRDVLAPSLIVYLKCDPVIELDRIRHRGREAERGITLSYLEQINIQLEQVLAEPLINDEIITIDSGLVDFAHDEAVKREILNQIGQKLKIQQDIIRSI
jgi:deoxyadenosine/deoxycytidine kinase